LALDFALWNAGFRRFLPSYGVDTEKSVLRWRRTQ
jgi:hypothetical protein